MAPAHNIVGEIETPLMSQFEGVLARERTRNSGALQAAEAVDTLLTGAVGLSANAIVDAVCLVGVTMSQSHSVVTAYHEAGHAVVALALGRGVMQVSVLPDRANLGVCEFGKTPVRPTEDWLEREMLIALGGLAAEAKYSGTYGWEGARRDLAYVRQLAIRRAGDKRAERLERRLLAKTEHLLNQDEHWRAVELIAAELVRLGTISGRAARHFFEQGKDEA